MKFPLLRLPAAARPGLALICIAVAATAVSASPQDSDGEPASAKPPSPPGRWETSHSIDVGGETVEYDAVVTGIQLDNDDGAAAAQLWYTAYFRTNGAAPRERPLVFSYLPTEGPARRPSGCTWGSWGRAVS